MKERLQQLLTKERLTPVKFAERVGVQRSSVSHILSGRNNPGLEFIQKILSKFPKVSSDWLISGHGEMYRTTENLSSTATTTINSGMREPEKHLFSSEEDKPSAYITKAAKLPSEPLNLNTEKTPVPTSSESSAIERIIIFFTDGSYKEYHTHRK